MSWQVDVSVWADKPDSIQVFSDDGQEQDYVPERTCKMVEQIIPIAPGYKAKALVCSECGEAIVSWAKYCECCGAKVVD